MIVRVAEKCSLLMFAILSILYLQLTHRTLLLLLKTFMFHLSRDGFAPFRHCSLSVNREEPLLLLRSLWSLVDSLLWSHHGQSVEFDPRDFCFCVRQTRTATTLSSQFAVMVVIVMAAFVDCNLMLLILLEMSAKT